MDNSHSLKTALRFINDIRKHRDRCHIIQQQTSRFNAEMIELERTKDAATASLETSNELRRALLYLPVNQDGFTLSLQTVLDIWIHLLPGPYYVNAHSSRYQNSPGSWFLHIFSLEDDEAMLSDDITMSIRHFV